MPDLLNYILCPDSKNSVEVILMGSHFEFIYTEKSLTLFKMVNPAPIKHLSPILILSFIVAFIPIKHDSPISVNPPIATFEAIKQCFFIIVSCAIKALLQIITLSSILEKGCITLFSSIRQFSPI